MDGTLAIANPTVVQLHVFHDVFYTTILDDSGPFCAVLSHSGPSEPFWAILRHSGQSESEDMLNKYEKTSHQYLEPEQRYLERKWLRTGTKCYGFALKCQYQT